MELDLRPPGIGFFLAASGALVAGISTGGSFIDLLPLALTLGMLFALGMGFAQRFGLGDRRKKN